MSRGVERKTSVKQARKLLATPYFEANEKVEMIA